MTDLAQWVAIIVTLFNAFITFLDKKVIKTFIGRRATSPGSAVTIESFKPVLQWRINRNSQDGIVRVNDSGLYYLNEEIYRSRRRSRRIRILILIALAVLIVFSILFISR